MSRNWCQHKISGMRENKYSRTNAITVLKSALDRYSILSGNYEKNGK